MRLAEFIVKNLESIVAEWERFAATLLPAAKGMSSLALRDHAEQILEAVAKDLATAQTPEEQEEKSKGWAPQGSRAPETAAQTHAVLRARSGFNINQLVAEYRALRATVLRLWVEDRPLDDLVTEELIRFNEAIDQAVAESVGHFHAQVERSRNLFLGMLGHDMRSPLNSILATAEYLADLNAGRRVSNAATRMVRSGSSMRTLLDDLVDFNRTKLGLGIEVVPSEIDLAAVVDDELDQMRGAYPHRRIEMVATGDHRGRWDGSRLQQLLRNLVSNAIKFGAADTPVRVAVRGEEADVWLEVTNRGPAIDESSLGWIFDPLKRGIVPEADEEGTRGGLGLGLFIVHEVAGAHGGEVEVDSDGEETTFAVRLPRHREDPPESSNGAR